MQGKTPKELFVAMLSELRQGHERSTKILQEIGQAAQDPDVKEALEARLFVADSIRDRIDQCFKLIGESPVKSSGRLYDIFVEEVRKDVAEIQNPTARNLYVLARASQLVHLRAAEYKSLIAAADLSGHYGVAVLLESCLADKLAFAERTARLIRALAQIKFAERLAEKVAGKQAVA
jgi:ferritin-like metal-binding protein YciE